MTGKEPRDSDGAGDPGGTGSPLDDDLGLPSASRAPVPRVVPEPPPDAAEDDGDKESPSPTVGDVHAGDADAAGVADDDLDAVAECIIALTTRQQSPEGGLTIGVSDARLAEALGGPEALETTLQQVRARILGLGMELVEYTHLGQRWFCLRSLYQAPTELSELQQAVLGTVIALCEADAASGSCTTGELSDKLVGAENRYMSKKRLDDALASLLTLGYLARSRRRWRYGPRLHVEFPRASREAIAEQARQLIT